MTAPLALVLIRGLPGSGKTTFAKLLLPGILCSNDHFWEGPSGYVFDRDKIMEAVEFCLADTRVAIRRAINKYSVVAVANTFSQHSEMQAYLELAREFECRVHVVDLFDAGLTDEELAARCIHNVPLHTIANMRARWEHGL